MLPLQTNNHCGFSIYAEPGRLFLVETKDKTGGELMHNDYAGQVSSEKPYFDRNFVCCTKKFNDKMVFLYLKHEAWNKNLNSKLGTKI